MKSGTHKAIVEILSAKAGGLTKKELSKALHWDEQRVYKACRQLIDDGVLTTSDRKTTEGRGAPAKVYCLATKVTPAAPNPIKPAVIKSHTSIFARIDALKAAVELIGEELRGLEAELKDVEE